MKKVKLAIVTLILGVTTYGGIQTYDYMTMTAAERMMMANIEALTASEGSGGMSCSGPCHTCSRLCLKCFRKWGSGTSGCAYNVNATCHCGNRL